MNSLTVLKTLKKITSGAFLTLGLLSTVQSLQAQELEAKVSINHQQVGNTTRTDVFEALQQKMESFLNEHNWTGMHFRENERIRCNFGVTVNTYSDTDNSFKCSLTVNVSRPVYNSTYTTTTYATKDPNFDFNFQTTDQFEYQGPDRLDNNLVAVLAYYAHMIIGYDLDSMAPLAGTQVFQTAEDICSTAENLGYNGWKAFGDNKNRFGLLNDLMDGSMESYRQLVYKYHREGLDQMADDTEKGRAAIAEALELLDASHQAKTMSQLPQLFTEYKRDELVNIFEGKGTSKERETVYNILSNIDPSQSSEWDKIK